MTDSTPTYDEMLNVIRLLVKADPITEYERAYVRGGHNRWFYVCDYCGNAGDSKEDLKHNADCLYANAVALLARIEATVPS